MICASSKDSDQPRHPPSLSESLLSAWKKFGSLATIESTAKTLIRLGGCRGWSSLRWAHMPLCWFCREAAQIWNSWQTIFTQEEHNKLKTHKSVYCHTCSLVQSLEGCNHWLCNFLEIFSLFSRERWSLRDRDSSWNNRRWCLFSVLFCFVTIPPLLNCCL